jgi:hypothetical protein
MRIAVIKVNYRAKYRTEKNNKDLRESRQNRDRLCFSMKARQHLVFISWWRICVWAAHRF